MYLLLIEYWFSVLSPPLVSMCRPICFFQCQYRLLEIKKTENWSLGPIFIHLLSWCLNFKQVSDYSVFLRCWLWGVRNQVLLWPEQCVRGCCIRAKVAHFKNVYFIFIDQTTNWLIKKIMDWLWTQWPVEAILIWNVSILRFRAKFSIYCWNIYAKFITTSELYYCRIIG